MLIDQARTGSEKTLLRGLIGDEGEVGRFYLCPKLYFFSPLDHKLFERVFIFVSARFSLKRTRSSIDRTHGHRRVFLGKKFFAVYVYRLLYGRHARPNKAAIKVARRSFPSEKLIIENEANTFGYIFRGNWVKRHFL